MTHATRLQVAPKRRFNQLWLWCSLALAVIGLTLSFVFSDTERVSTAASNRSAATTPKLGKEVAEHPARAASESDPGSQRLTPSAEPPEAPSTPPAGFDLEISGTVVDATGGAVVGALVVARADSARVASAVSGEAGEFALAVPAGEFALSARADAYSDASAWSVAPARGVRLVLAPSASISGKVVARTTGEPIADVTVVAEGPEGGAHPARSTRSGQDGGFSFSSLAAGQYQLEASSPEWRSERLSQSVSIGEASELIELRVSPAGVLSATVLVDGEECADGFVRLNGPVWSNAGVLGGQARVEGVIPGSYTVDVGCEGALGLTEPLEVELGLTSRTWELSGGLSLRGRVMGADGQAVASAHVRVLPEPGSELASVDCASDAAGDFECRGLVPGAYTCEVVSEFGSLSEPVKVQLSSETPELVLQASPSGTIRALVASRRPGDASPRVFARRAGYPPTPGSEDASGWVSFERVPLGAYVVYVGAGAENDATATPARLERHGQVLELTLNAPPTTEIAGRVLDPAGEPVVDAWVRVTGSDAAGQPPAALTDSDGRFTIPDVIRTSRYDLHIEHALGHAALAGVEPGPEVVLRLRPSASLTLRAQAPDGSSVHSFDVSYRRVGGDAREQGIQHGAGIAGEWSSPRLEPGRYHVFIRALGLYASKELDVAAGDPVSTSLTLEREISASVQEFWAAGLAPPER
jgi:hypothetical protein